MEKAQWQRPEDEKRAHPKASILNGGILPAAQRSLWPKLADVARHSFVLYGGTAVALYLGHRESVDFDFFTHGAFQPDDLFSQPLTVAVPSGNRDIVARSVHMRA